MMPSGCAERVEEGIRKGGGGTSLSLTMYPPVTHYVFACHSQEEEEEAEAVKFYLGMGRINLNVRQVETEGRVL